jgi:hypothetical protein
MSIFPTTREDRWSLLLSALGAYIIGMPLVGMFSILLAEFAGWTDLGKWSSGAASVLRREEAHRYSVLGCIYLLCLAALFFLVPALADRRARRAALAIWALGLVFLVIFIYPMTQIVMTR